MGGLAWLRAALLVLAVAAYVAARGAGLMDWLGEPIDISTMR